MVPTNPSADAHVIAGRASGVDEDSELGDARSATITASSISADSLGGSCLGYFYLGFTVASKRVRVKQCKVRQLAGRGKVNDQRPTSDLLDYNPVKLDRLLLLDDPQERIGIHVPPEVHFNVEK
jgi:hypothetical protein